MVHRWYYLDSHPPQKGKNVTEQETIQQDGRILVEDTLIRSVYAKTEMCKTSPMTDNPALLLIAVESDETNPAHDVCVEFQREVGLSKPYHVAMIPLVHKDDVAECLDDVVRSMPIARFDFMVLAVESYVKSMAKEDDAPSRITNFERGQLEQEFRDNPFTDVREAIAITAIDFGATTLFTAISPYVYDDKGVPMFSEEDTTADQHEMKDGEESNGRIPDMLIAICRYMQTAIMMDGFGGLMNDARKKGGE